MTTPSEHVRWTLSLDRLPAGSRGRIRSVTTDESDADENPIRLEHLGLCAGRTVEVLRQGDPLIVRVHSSRIGLAAEKARRVTVDVVDRRAQEDA